MVAASIPTRRARRISRRKRRHVLVIFCSGALSHLDTWDYKPELIKRHDQPMPGTDKLITFQGENGNLVKPLWEFRPRGQRGKMISDLLPQPRRTGGRAVLHPFDDREDRTRTARPRTR